MPVQVTLDSIIAVLKGLGLGTLENSVSEYFIVNDLEVVALSDVAKVLLKAAVPGSTALQVKNTLVKQMEPPTQVCVCVCVCVYRARAPCLRAA